MQDSLCHSRSNFSDDLSAREAAGGRHPTQPGKVQHARLCSRIRGSQYRTQQTWQLYRGRQAFAQQRLLWGSKAMQMFSRGLHIRPQSQGPRTWSETKQCWISSDQQLWIEKTVKHFYTHSLTVCPSVTDVYSQLRIRIAGPTSAINNPFAANDCCQLSLLLHQT